jgi:hypothetical protein
MSKSSGYSPENIVSSGADYVKQIAPFCTIKDLQGALKIALIGDRLNYSKTLIKTLEREIRRKRTSNLLKEA